MMWGERRSGTHSTRMAMMCGCLPAAGFGGGVGAGIGVGGGGVGAGCGGGVGGAVGTQPGAVQPDVQFCTFCWPPIADFRRQEWRPLFDGSRASKPHVHPTQPVLLAHNAQHSKSVSV